MPAADLGWGSKVAERDLPSTAPAELEGGTTAPTGAGPLSAPDAAARGDEPATRAGWPGGGVVAFLGLARTMGFRHLAIGLAAMAIGCWLFASSFLLGGTPGADWMARSMGAIVFFLGFTGMARSTPTPGREAATSDLRSEA